MITQQQYITYGIGIVAAIVLLVIVFFVLGKMKKKDKSLNEKDTKRVNLVVKYIKECRNVDMTDKEIIKKLRLKNIPVDIIKEGFIDEKKESMFDSEDVFTMLRLGKKYIEQSNDIDKTFELMNKYIRKHERR